MNKRKMIVLAICSLMLSINSCKPDQGDPGQTGPIGDAGKAGIAGQNGPVGPKGVTGDKGQTGDKGATGTTGSTSITTKSQTLGEWKLVRETKSSSGDINLYFDSQNDNPSFSKNVIDNSIVNFFIKTIFSGSPIQVLVTQSGNSYFSISGISGYCTVLKLENEKVTFRMNIKENILSSEEVKKRLDNEKLTYQASIITFN